MSNPTTSKSGRRPKSPPGSNRSAATATAIQSRSCAIPSATSNGSRPFARQRLGEVGISFKLLLEMWDGFAAGSYTPFEPEPPAGLFVFDPAPLDGALVFEPEPPVGLLGFVPEP